MDWEQIKNMKLNDEINTEEIIHGNDNLFGKALKLVGKKYLFMGDHGLQIELNQYADGFDPDEHRDNTIKESWDE